MSVDVTGWWYDRSRCLFCCGVYPVLDNAVTEELVRSVLGNPRGFPRHLVEKANSLIELIDGREIIH